MKHNTISTSQKRGQLAETATAEAIAKWLNKVPALNKPEIRKSSIKEDTFGGYDFVISHKGKKLLLDVTTNITTKNINKWFKSHNMGWKFKTDDKGNTNIVLVYQKGSSMLNLIKIIARELEFKLPDQD